MLSVRLPAPIERDLGDYCARNDVTKSQVVQAALTEWLAKAQAHKQAKRKSQPADLPFLAPDAPIRKFIGSVKTGPTTDEWMAITRGDDWKRKT